MYQHIDRIKNVGSVRSSMEEIKIVHNRKLVFAIIGSALVISLFSFNIVITLCLLSAAYLIVLHNNPFKFKWIKEQLTVLRLSKTGIRFYSYETEIPWEDIESYHVRYSLFKYYLCIRLKENRVMTDEKQYLIDKLQETISLDRTILDRPLEPDVIEYPYDFIKMTSQELKYNLDHFMAKYSGQFSEMSEDKEEIKENPLGPIALAGFGVVFVCLFYPHLNFFLLASFIGTLVCYNFVMSFLVTPLMILTSKGIQLPSRNLKLDWADLKLIEIIERTRDCSGYLVIWFKDIKSFLDKKPRYLASNNYTIDYDKDNVLKTGRVKIKFTATLLGENLIREKFYRYIERYGKGVEQKEMLQDVTEDILQEIQQEVQGDEQLHQEEHLHEEKKVSLSKEKEEYCIIENNIDEQPTTEMVEKQTIIHEIELQKLVEVQFKSGKIPKQMIVLKEEDGRCLAMRVEGLRLDGYCIFLKDQVKHISYCHGFYNELLQKEYYFKLKSAYNIDLTKWDKIFNSYYVKNQFVEVKTKNDIYKGKVMEITEENLSLKAFSLDGKGLTETVTIESVSILHVSFETSELTVLKKYA